MTVCRTVKQYVKDVIIMTKEDKEAYELTMKIVRLCQAEKASPRMTIAATALAFVSACDVAGVSADDISAEVSKWRERMER